MAQKRRKKLAYTGPTLFGMVDETTGGGAAAAASGAAVAEADPGSSELPVIRHIDTGKSDTTKTGAGAAASPGVATGGSGVERPKGAERSDVPAPLTFTTSAYQSSANGTRHGSGTGRNGSSANGTAMLEAPRAAWDDAGDAPAPPAPHRLPRHPSALYGGGCYVPNVALSDATADHYHQLEAGGPPTPAGAPVPPGHVRALYLARTMNHVRICGPPWDMPDVVYAAGGRFPPGWHECRRVTVGLMAVVREKVAGLAEAVTAGRVDEFQAVAVVANWQRLVALWESGEVQQLVDHDDGDDDGGASIKEQQP